MRIVHVAHGWPASGADGGPAAGRVGGTERYAAALVEAQRALGADASSFTPADIPAEGRARGFTASWRSPSAEAAFSRVLTTTRPDVVHFHHLSGLSLGLGPMARAAGAAAVLTLHDAWLDCARGQLIDLTGRSCPGPDTRRCAACLAPALYAPLPGAAHLPLRLAPIEARRAAVDRFYSSMNLVLSPSRHLGALLGRPARYLPLPLLTPAARRPDPAPGPVRFLYVGALIPTKGPHLVVEAYAALPRGAATLDLVGPAPAYRGDFRYADALRRRARDVPGVHVHPAAPPGELAHRYATADVLIFASTWVENSPLVLREARAAGLRIVAADVPGAREVAPDARFFPPGEVPALRRVLAAEVRLPRLGGQGVAEGPTLLAHTQSLLELYEAAHAGV